MRVSRTILGAIVIALATSAPTPAVAAIPAAASYQATITGAVYEWSALAGGYQQTGTVNLPALLFVEPRRIAPQPTSPVVGLFTGSTPALDQRPGAINFATNTQGFHVNPNVVGPTQAAIDVAIVQADPAAGALQAQVDTNAARTVTVELFRTSPSFISAPAQILAGTLRLQFSPDGTTVTGSFDLAGNGLIEPGNPLFPVRRYVANLSGQATSITPAPAGGQAPGAAGTATLDSVRAPAGSIARAGRKGIAVRLSCTTACRAHARLSISRAAARRARLRRTSVGSAIASRQTSGPFTVRVKLSKRARSKLHRLRRVRVTVSITVTTADGVKHPFQTRLTLRR